MIDRLIATYSTSYIIYTALSVAVAATVIYRMYVVMGNSVRWQSPWKRLLIVSPAIAVWVFVVVTFLQP